MSRQRTLEAILSAEYITIGELVRLTGMRYSTLKYYTEECMLPFEQKEENLTRRYERIPTLQRLEQIRNYKQQGLNITEIKKALCDVGE